MCMHIYVGISLSVLDMCEHMWGMCTYVHRCIYHSGWRLMRTGYRTCFHTYDEKNMYVLVCMCCEVKGIAWLILKFRHILIDDKIERKLIIGENENLDEKS